MVSMFLTHGGYITNFKIYSPITNIFTNNCLLSPIASLLGKSDTASCGVVTIHLEGPASCYSVCMAGPPARALGFTQHIQTSIISEIKRESSCEQDLTSVGPGTCLELVMEMCRSLRLVYIRIHPRQCDRLLILVWSRFLPLSLGYLVPDEPIGHHGPGLGPRRPPWYWIKFHICDCMVI